MVAFSPGNRVLGEDLMMIAHDFLFGGSGCYTRTHTNVLSTLPSTGCCPLQGDRQRWLHECTRAHESLIYDTGVRAAVLSPLALSNLLRETTEHSRFQASCLTKHEVLYAYPWYIYEYGSSYECCCCGSCVSLSYRVCQTISNIVSTAPAAE